MPAVLPPVNYTAVLLCLAAAAHAATDLRLIEAVESRDQKAVLVLQSGPMSMPPGPMAPVRWLGRSTATTPKLPPP